MVDLMVFVTNLANWKSILFLNIVILILYFRQYKKEVLILIISSLSDLIIIEPLKKIIAEPRPIGGILPETSFSMPSGHAYTAVVFYGLITYFLYKKFKIKYLLLFGTLLILLIAYSRIFLGVHYWWDVVVGIVLGVVWLIGVRYLL